MDARLPPGAIDLSLRYPDFPPGYAPRKIPVDGGAPPPGYHLGSEPRSALWVTGLAVFAASYGPSILVAGTAVSEGEEDVAPLFVPIAGPWITARTADAEGGARGFLVLSGLAQLTGAGLFIAGMAAQRDVFVRNDVRGATTSAPRVDVAVGPGNLALSGGF